MVDWIPVVFFIFKFLVLGTGMFYAIKWHYDQGKKKGKEEERRAVLRASVKVVVGFVLTLLVLTFVTYILAKTFGMDLNMNW
ncbi:hypothetical protein ASF61_10730 [Duganella sp. Leaf126]|uniref:hypothetical protein n=1 Tax=Duganella sp. Leaf126 TaxID=1736266 RepID=UPI0006F89992|nr:hypothetical protein [Duganella sp. Leaf126]KQQ33541.1 hypothetical protein ASF61_10730 [Duganella sp. Leaf126]